MWVEPTIGECLKKQKENLNNYWMGQWYRAYLESSSSKKELLTALFESSVINTLILDMT